MTLVARNSPKLTLAGAQAVLAAAQKRAAEIGIPMDIAVVDDGGHLLAFARMDGAKLSSVEIAYRKAHCAAIRRQPTGPARSGDEINMLASLSLAISSGGLPLQIEGVCIGAIGVSNGSEDQDLDVASAGVKALDHA